MNKSTVFDLSKTTPTMLADELRAAAQQALDMAVDPLNHMDNNPFIGREWIAVSTELYAAARALEQHLDWVFFAPNPE